MTNPKGLSFVDRKQLCSLTDGNLARHLQVLEAEGMVQSSKEHDQSRPQTITRITAAGRKRYVAYLNILEQVVCDAAAAQTVNSDHKVAPFAEAAPAFREPSLQ
jgi:predicted ArsR family transcriptional regulator